MCKRQPSAGRLDAHQDPPVYSHVRRTLACAQKRIHALYMQPVTPLCSSRFNTRSTSGDCRGAATHHNALDSDDSAALWADRSSASESASLHADCASLFVFMAALFGRFHHARPQRRCSMAGIVGTRCHVACLLCRTSSQAMARKSF